MRYYVRISQLLLILFFLVSCEQQPSGRIDFNTAWTFHRMGDSDNGEDEFCLVDFDDSAWEQVRLPHTANIEPLVVNDQWQGICWYRKVFSVPMEYKDKKVFMELEAAMNHSKIWVNGEEVRVHQGGYLPVLIDLSKYLQPGEDNIITVRLNNTDNPITGPKPLRILDFNMYGGLYRNASLTVKEKVYISHPVLANRVAGGGVFVTFPRVSEELSEVSVKTHVINEQKEAVSVELVQSLLFQGTQVISTKSDPVKIDAGRDMEFVDLLPLEDAKLWSPKDPNLYQLHTTVLVDGEPVDQESTRIGIREFSFKNRALYINGEKNFLRGVNRHQEYPFIGYALSDNAQYRDAVKIKEAGFNHIRLSHYPQSPAFMDACDELGLVVTDAILGWQYYLDNDQFREYCYRSATELVRRDRNHASVLAWEVSLNETRMPVFFMEELHRIVHEEYPGEHSYSCGWMDDVYDLFLQARQHRIMHGYEEPEKPYVVSEYGDWEYYSSNAGLNQHRYSKDIRYEKSSRQLRRFGEARLLQQAANIQEAHNDNLNTTAFSDNYWVMYDYNRGYHEDIESSGIMDIFRLPKFAYYFYKSQQEPEEEVVLDIASYWTTKSPLDVKVFSNCDEVELYLNDLLIARQNPDQGPNTGNLAHAPFTFKLENFESGKLKAVGFLNGKQVAEDVALTPRDATGLKLWLDESGKAPEAGSNDVLFLYIAAVDEQGVIVPDYTAVVDLEIEGDVSLVNPAKVECEAGIATAVLRIGESNGGIRIKAKSGNLVAQEFHISVE